MEALSVDPDSGPIALPPPVAIPHPRRPKAAPRPMPVRSENFDHLTLERLRSYRNELTAEESRVSYWRRILQARLDVLREGRISSVDPKQLTPVLTDARVSAGRTALIQVMPVDHTPPLPDLASLWARQVDHDSPDSAEHRQSLDSDLVAAETQLSEYRNSLHLKLGAATGELIARYREDPLLCLTALPMRP